MLIVSTSFSANVNNFPSPETTKCTCKDKFAACDITPKRKIQLTLLIPETKFSLHLLIFIVKIKVEISDTIFSFLIPTPIAKLRSQLIPKTDPIPAHKSNNFFKT